MIDLKFIDNARWNCPRCNTVNGVCIELVEIERVKCLVCQVYFNRVNKTKRFESADGKKIFIDEVEI